MSSPNDAPPSPLDPEAPSADAPHARALIDRYWRRNLRIMGVLLVVWAVVGLGCGVLFADTLNAFRLGGFPLGFWFAQQGSIIVFVLLILVYCLAMNRLDRRHHAELEAICGRSPEGAR